VELAKSEHSRHRILSALGCGEGDVLLDKCLDLPVADYPFWATTIAERVISV
jgi:hypothetical protein